MRLLLLVALAVYACEGVQVNSDDDFTSLDKLVTYDKLSTWRDAGPQGIPPARPFTKADSLVNLMYSYAAYCPLSAIGSWTCKWCNTNVVKGFIPVTTFANASTGEQGFLGVRRSEIIVSFRGSSNINNWIQNLKFAPMSTYPLFGFNSSVHQGFLEVFESVKLQMHNGLVQAMVKCPDCTSITFTGHSLGAAVATLAAASFRVNYGDSWNITLFTFGEPRVGNIAFEVFFNKNVTNNTYRVVNQRDIVPHLPFRKLGFHHIPTEIWYWDDKYQTCDSTGEDHDCSDGLTFNTSVDDHLEYMGIREDC